MRSIGEKIVRYRPRSGNKRSQRTVVELLEDDDARPQKPKTLLPEDLLALQQEFSEQFSYLQEEVRADLSRAHLNVGLKLRTYGELLLARQQNLLEKMIVKPPGYTPTSLFDARHHVARHDRPIFTSPVSSKPVPANQPALQHTEEVDIAPVQEGVSSRPLDMNGQHGLATLTLRSTSFEDQMDIQSNPLHTMERCPSPDHSNGVAASGLMRSRTCMQELPGEVVEEMPAEHATKHTTNTPESVLRSPTVSRGLTLPARTLSSMASKHTTSPFANRETILSKIWNSQDAGGPGRRRAVFADVDDLKAKMREQMTKDEYDVRHLYKTSGCCQQIARSHHFEHLTMGVIAFNAVWMGIESDHNPEAVLSDSPIVFQIAAHFFCAYFVVEWSIRLLSFARKSQSVTDGWFVFDTVLVLLTVVETWFITIFFAVKGRSSGEDSSLEGAGSLRLLRLLRLTRMGRILKLLRSVPEIVTILKGMTVATRTVSFTLMLLVLIIYVFGMCFASLTKGLAVGEEYFSTVPHAMETLLLHGTFLEDMPDLWKGCVTESPFSAIILLLYILIATITLMNTLIGVLCEVISVVSAVEKEGLVTTYVRGILQGMWADCDIEIAEDTMISKHEFECLIQHPRCAKSLNDVEIDVLSLVDFAASIFREPSAKMSFPDFVDLLLNLRGTNTARVKDIMDLRKLVFSQMNDKAEGRHQFIKSRVFALETMLYHIAVTLHPDLKKTLKRPTQSEESAVLT